MEAYEELVARLAGLGSAALGYSGGVDSTLLARALGDALGERALLLLADVPMLPRSELARARELARLTGVPLQVLQLNPLNMAEVAENGPERCYHCKHMLFSALRAEADRRGIPYLLDGSNRDDAGEVRPGRRALAELGVLSPLAHLTKQQIREMSRYLGLPTADKPALACLATRIPTGEVLTAEKLARVERAEDFLAGMGYYGGRVRAHGELARVELPRAARDRLGADPEGMDRLAAGLQAAGFRFTALDLMGYRTGSMNGGERNG